ncbi:MAG: hypothetical protein ACOC8F_03135, partial [Planctomycetota bacterium]
RRVGDRVLMLHDGRFIADTTPDALENVDNKVVARFVRGRAAPEELARLEGGPLGRQAASRQETP